MLKKRQLTDKERAELRADMIAYGIAAAMALAAWLFIQIFSIEI